MARPKFTVDAAVVGAKRMLILSLTETLVALHQQIKANDKRVSELLEPGYRMSGSHAATNWPYAVCVLCMGE